MTLGRVKGGAQRASAYDAHGRDQGDGISAGCEQLGGRQEIFGDDDRHDMFFNFLFQDCH
jgi:hypothetical protein